MMLATPDAFLVTKITRLTTFLRALAMLAVVAAFVLAWRTVFGARLTATVTTEESAATLSLAWLMDSTMETTRAVTYNVNQSIKQSFLIS